LRNAALTGTAIWVADRAFAEDAKSPNERVAFACIGVGGKGESDSNDAGRLGDVVAICDVDENTLNRAAQRFPNAKKYNDYRKMLDEMGKSIDAVTVSTPDHHHGPAAATAMHMGKACFCQKPLAHSLYEVRTLGEIARKKKVATQMGNQGTAADGLRRSAARLRAGALGAVKEVHVWTNRPIWPQGIARNPPKPVPANLHWDLWIGPAKERPYADGYHPFNWRGWWDFGTGALGDMACHTMNMPFMGLDLRDPISVVAETTENNRDSYPSGSKIVYEFAATASRPALTMTWYDGVKRPPAELIEGLPHADSASLVIGEKGKLYTPGDYGEDAHWIGVDPPEVDFVHSPGHFEEFVRAIKGGEPAMSNFPNYASPLAETVLLGNLAVWAGGKKVEWDAKHLKAKNAPEVEEIIHPKLLHGYSL
jgi:predicted dehydrogenase